MKLSKWAICVFCVMLVGFMFSTSPVFGQAKPIELDLLQLLPRPSQERCPFRRMGQRDRKKNEWQSQGDCFPGRDPHPGGPVL